MSIPEFWTSTVAKVLVGEQPCLLSAWAPAHLHVKRERDNKGSLVKWKADHTALLTKCQAALKEDGWRLDVERYFRVTGQTAILAGKADIIAQAPSRRPLIVDAKSGEPRDTDAAQVLIEMVMIPMAWQATMTFDGLVIYGGNYPDVKVTPSQADAIRPRIFETLRRLGKPEQPDPNPGRDACRWCSVPESVCAVRYSDEAVATTVEF